MTRGRYDRNPEHVVRCLHCDERIEGIVGALGDWVHVGTRRERCEDGRVAEPREVLR